MDDYKEHLRRLAVHDDALVNAIAMEASSFAASVLDERTTALVRIAATSPSTRRRPRSSMP